MTTVSSIVAQWPCENDESCTAVLTCSNLCDLGKAAIQLSDFARQTAANLATQCRHVPDKSRRELAAYIADGLDNALYDIGGRLDINVFMHLAGFEKVTA